MRKILLGLCFVSGTALAGTLESTGEEGLWAVDGDPNTLLLLESKKVQSQLVGNDVIYSVTGAYGNTVSKTVVPVYGSCIVVPTDWNTGEFAQCSIRGAGMDATIILDTNGDGTYTAE